MSAFMEKTVLVFRTMDRGTWRETFGAIASFAKAAGWNLQQVESRMTKPRFEALANFWRPDGIIGSCFEFLPKLVLHDIPTVLINSTSNVTRDSSVIVRTDNAEIARTAMGELLRLHPSSILFVGWSQPTLWAALRRREAARIAALHDIAFSSVMPDAHAAGDTIHLLERIVNRLRSLPRPVGVFAAADDTGALALSAALRLGLKIPSDVAVVAVDDDPEICENFSPTLSSVKPDYERIGRTAAETLARLMNHESVPRCTAVPLSGIVRRASTTLVKTSDVKVEEALELIRLKSCDGLKASRIVKLFGTSLRVAEKRFHNATGSTIGAAIIERRFAEATHHLREGCSSIEAIANFCGWNSSAAFRKAFKSHFGISPLAWRKQ